MREIKLPSKTTQANVYDNDNIPEIDLPGKASIRDNIPDEVPGRSNSGEKN